MALLRRLVSDDPTRLHVVAAASPRRASAEYPRPPPRRRRDPPPMAPPPTTLPRVPLGGRYFSDRSSHLTVVSGLTQTRCLRGPATNLNCAAVKGHSATHAATRRKGAISRRRRCLSKCVFADVRTVSIRRRPSSDERRRGPPSDDPRSVAGLRRRVVSAFVLGQAAPRSALGRSKSPGSPPEYRAGLHDRERAARSQHHKSSPEKESLRVVDVQR